MSVYCAPTERCGAPSTLGREGDGKKEFQRKQFHYHHKFHQIPGYISRMWVYCTTIIEGSYNAHDIVQSGLKGTKTNLCYCQGVFFCSTAPCPQLPIPEISCYEAASTSLTALRLGGCPVQVPPKIGKVTERKETL